MDKAQALMKTSKNNLTTKHNESKHVMKAKLQWLRADEMKWIQEKILKFPSTQDIYVYEREPN